jgi:membrane protein DedA with SNARE-associated domain
MTFFTVLVAAFIGATIGQAFCFWVIGTLAHRQEMAKARAIQQAIMEAHKETQEKEAKMREYVRLES